MNKETLVSALDIKKKEVSNLSRRLLKIQREEFIQKALTLEYEYYDYMLTSVISDKKLIARYTSLMPHVYANVTQDHKIRLTFGAKDSLVTMKKFVNEHHIKVHFTDSYKAIDRRLKNVVEECDLRIKKLDSLVEYLNE